MGSVFAFPWCAGTRVPWQLLIVRAGQGILGPELSAHVIGWLVDHFSQQKLGWNKRIESCCNLQTLLELNTVNS